MLNQDIATGPCMNSCGCGRIHGDSFVPSPLDILGENADIFSLNLEDVVSVCFLCCSFNVHAVGFQDVIAYEQTARQSFGYVYFCL